MVTRSVVLIGRRWSSRASGYHTTQIIVNGLTVHNTAQAWGASDQYAQSGWEWLRENGYLPDWKDGPFHWFCSQNNINVTCVGIDVPRERDL